MTRSKKQVGKLAESPGRRERRRFTDEFKREAVRLMYERRANGVPVSQIARELDVGPEQLRVWDKQLRERDDEIVASLAETPEQELRRLRREVATLRQEREFAKKVAVYFAKESR